MTANNSRIESIDLLKGIVIVIMALDHTRDYFHADAFLYEPTDPLKASLALFFTRWITHFCAPVFSFLAGLSAFFVGQRKSKAEVSGFLLKRGIWLILLEVSLISFGWYFDPHYTSINLLVIWCLGVSMVVLAGLIHLPKNMLLVFCLLLILGHNAFDSVHFEGNILWQLLHEPGIIELPGNRVIAAFYPLVPWIAVMGLGYYFGYFYAPGFGADKRKKILIWISGASILLFLFLRYFNIYGDPNAWQSFGSFSKGIISFLNPEKYPPSLQYLLMTIGPALLFLAFTETANGKAVSFFALFGRVPFFFYIVHIYLIHLIAMVFAEVSGFGWQLLILPYWVTMVPELQGYGIGLWGVYGVWILVLALLYPLCKRFDAFKLSNKDRWWLSYL